MWPPTYIVCGATHTTVGLSADFASASSLASAAGWTVCLAELGKHLAGPRAGGPHSDTAKSWRRHYDDYVAAGMPSGAGIPAGG